MSAREELLHSSDRWLQRRRTVTAIAAGLASEFAIIGMRQYGVIRRLPDPPGFDSNAVVTSKAAYPFGVPDASLAIIGAGAIVATALARGTSKRGRWLDVLLGAGVVGGALGAAVYLGQMVRMRKACAYCLVGAAGFFSLVPLALPGVIRSARR